MHILSLTSYNIKHNVNETLKTISKKSWKEKHNQNGSIQLIIMKKHLQWLTNNSILTFHQGCHQTNSWPLTIEI